MTQRWETIINTILDILELWGVPKCEIIMLYAYRNIEMCFLKLRDVHLIAFGSQKSDCYEDPQTYSWQKPRFSLVRTLYK